MAQISTIEYNLNNIIIGDSFRMIKSNIINEEGVNTIVTRTKSIIKKEDNPNGNEENKTEDKKDEEHKENNEENKEEKKDENKEENKEINETGDNVLIKDNLTANNPTSEEKVQSAPEQSLDTKPAEGS